MTNDLAGEYTNFIEKYEIDKYFIRIYYLNGTKETCELSLYNIDKLNEKMVEEALVIIQEHFSKKFKSERSMKELKVTFLTMAGVLTSAAMLELSIKDPNDTRMLCELIASICIPAFIYAYRKRENINDDYDIKKYQMFIEHKDEFEKNNYKENIYNGIHKKGYVSINNLDSYSYEEIKMMVDNIQKTRKIDKR